MLVIEDGRIIKYGPFRGEAKNKENKPKKKVIKIES